MKWKNSDQRLKNANLGSLKCAVLPDSFALFIEQMKGVNKLIINNSRFISTEGLLGLQAWAFITKLEQYGFPNLRSNAQHLMHATKPEKLSLATQQSINLMKTFNGYILLTKLVKKYDAEVIQSIKIGEVEYICAFTAPDRIPFYIGKEDLLQFKELFISSTSLFNRDYMKGLSFLLFDLSMFYF